MEQEEKKILSGGEFLITPTKRCYTPEDFTEEQNMIARLCDDFLEKEVFPNLKAIDEQQAGLMVSLLDKAAELGLLQAAFPQAYGGLGEDFITATLITEHLGAGHSFAVAIAAHNGIGSLPILYFGTEAQKKKYIPSLANAAMKGAYALTEPTSGSDALAAKTTATLSEDGKHYILNGQKIWITNAGFADVFTVFAKIDGEDFTAFIVERNTPGFTIGAEEDKMGIKGSSTRPLFFEDCKIPVENLLGEKGRGHIISFNILNIGRLKLCAAALGSAKKALQTTLEYAKNREQFQQPISNFGAIQHKIAEMHIRIFAAESVLYRTAAYISQKEKALIANGMDEAATLLGAAEEYAIECAMLKIIGSECLDFVVDEGVQIHGGNGFMNDYDISRAYRDSRINRIFEGTNEINRLLVLDMYLKRSMKGRIDLMKPATAIQKELMSIPNFSSPGNKTEELSAYIENFKKAILLCAGAAVQKLMNTLETEQEILMNLADMLIDTYQAETIWLRAKNHFKDEKHIIWDVVQVFIADAADRMHHAGKNIIHAFAEGDEQRMMLIGLKRFTKTAPFNTKNARRKIAMALID